MNAKNRDARVESGAALFCPSCGAALVAERRAPGIVQRCGACGGFGLTIEALRNERGAGAAAALWTSVVRAPRNSPRRCPSCGAPFAAVRTPRSGGAAFAGPAGLLERLALDFADPLRVCGARSGLRDREVDCLLPSPLSLLLPPPMRIAAEDTSR